MLKAMRDSFKHLKWILFLVIFVFVLLVFVDWGGAGRQGGGVSGYAARVNGDSITIDDFYRALNFTEKRYEQMYGRALTEAQKKQMGLRRQVLQTLVNQQLLVQQAKDLNLEATPQEVKNEILRIPQLNPNGQFVGAKLYRRWVTMNGYHSAAAFESDLKQDITLNKMENVLASSVVIPPQVVVNEYRKRNESTKIRYVMVPVRETMGAAKVTPAEVDAYYREHRQKYKHPEQKHVKYLIADMARIRSSIKVTEADERQAYEANKESYKTGEEVHAQHILLRTPAGAPAALIANQKKKGEEILARIKKGEDFGALAKEYSEDPGSAAKGGDLGFFGKGQMVPQFEKEAFALQPGQVSGLVRSQFGWHIIKVLGKRPPGYRPFEEVRADIERTLRAQRAKDAAREAILRVKAKIGDATTMADAQLRALSNDTVSYDDAGWFGRTEMVRGLGRVPELNDWAFKAAQGAIGDVMETARGPIIPRLAGTRDAGITPLAEIRPRVENDARLAKAREAASQKIESIYKKGETLDAVAKALSTEVKEATIHPEQPVSGFTGNTKPLSDAAVKTGVDQFGGPVVIDEGAVLYQVTAQNKVDPAALEKAKGSIASDLRQAEAQKIRATLLDRLRRDANIVLNESLLTQEAPPPGADS